MSYAEQALNRLKYAGNRRRRKNYHEWRLERLTGLEYRPLTPNEIRLQTQHIHPVACSLDTLFENFLKLPVARQKRAQDYSERCDRWKIDWAWHKQNYRREAILHGITQTEYAQRYRIPHRRAWNALHKAGGASLRALFWVYHRRQFQREKVENGLSVGEYIVKYQLTQKSAARQLSRRPMSAEWGQYFDIYYQSWWPEGYSVSDFAKAAGLKETTARQHLYDFPEGIIDPMLLKPFL